MSLLRRIEQGQGKPAEEQKPQEQSSGDGSRLATLQARRVTAPTAKPQAGTYFDLKTRVQNKLLAELDPSMDISKTEEVRHSIQELFEQILNV
jgi:hypothetical protein